MASSDDSHTSEQRTSITLSGSSHIPESGQLTDSESRTSPAEPLQPSRPSSDDQHATHHTEDQDSHIGLFMLDYDPKRIIELTAEPESIDSSTPQHQCSVSSSIKPDVDTAKGGSVPECPPSPLSYDIALVEMDSIIDSSIPEYNPNPEISIELVSQPIISNNPTSWTERLPLIGRRISRQSSQG